MMEHVAGGNFVGVPLSPNEQVLRAVCYCDKAAFAHHRLRRVDPLMPIRFATGGNEKIRNNSTWQSSEETMSPFTRKILQEM